MKVFHGDSKEILKRLPNDYIDAVVTDPPYGLAFMNKKWDYDVPSVDLWREVYRVLKPGGHVLSFGGTRTYHRMVVNIEDAGFEIRDQLQWIFGSGFPKSHNLKDEWQGWGTALKPANEPICLARKPLEKGLTVAENVLKWGCGAINVDASRISTQDNLNGGAYSNNRETSTNEVYGEYKRMQPTDFKQPQGRWPANVLLDEESAALLNEQSGVSKSTKLNTVQQARSDLKAKGAERLRVRIDEGFSDSGGASRFFYVAKASKRERNAGLEGMPLKEIYPQNNSLERKELNATANARVQNHHPTVKPIKLMEYLITLVTPPNGTVLDPFMGSGSTGVAAKNLNFKFIGVELNEEYVEIAKKRINTPEAQIEAY